VENDVELRRQPGCWLRSSHSLKECVIAHWSSDSNGSACGLHTSENAGMSSANYVRIIMAESLRFLEEGSSAPSKPGAKVRRKRVADAHTVEIP